MNQRQRYGGYSENFARCIFASKGNPALWWQGIFGYRQGQCRSHFRVSASRFAQALTSEDQPFCP